MTRMICAVALLLLGFSGHAFADASSDPHRLQYELPDGSYASLCQPGEEKGDTHGGGKHCDVCVMSIGHLFVPPETVAFVITSSILRQAVQRDGNANLKPILSFHGQSRAPPLNA